MTEQAWGLIVLCGGMLLVLIIASVFTQRYSLNRIKSKTVGDGQHGTARWATPKEIRQTYKHVPFQVDDWRRGENRPEAQGIVLGCIGRASVKAKKHSKHGGLKALVDCDDVHFLMIGASGVGKTAFFLYPNLEYACACGMSFLALDTKGDLARNYSCVARLAKRIEKKEGIGKLTGLEHYCQPGDRNFIVYHCRNTDMNERIETILKDADQLLLRSAAQYQETEEYRLLVRCLDEQTIAGSGGRRLRKKGEESPSTTSLQNPTDPDATYCVKAGKDHIGYAANVVESVDSSGSVITDYQYEKNIFSDPRFLRDHLTRTEEQKETVRIVADGGYVGQECRELAAEKNIELINTALKGVAVPDIYGGFLLSDNGKSVQQCPAGYAPIRCSYTERTSRIRAYFKSEHCMGCDHREECQAKQRRATCQMSLSRSAVERARQQQQMHAPDFQNWHRIRNGIESVPSILRNRYQVDKMPVRGFIPSKFFFGAKISAMNFNKLLRHRRGLLSCAQNPLLS